MNLLILFLVFFYCQNCFSLKEATGSGDVNCFLHTVDGICLQCVTGYYVNLSGVCEICLNMVTNCLECEK